MTGSGGGGGGTPEGLPRGYPFNPAMEVTPRQVRAQMQDPAAKLTLIDCRSQGEWNTARIHGAMLIPLDQMAQRVGEIEAAAKSGGPIVIHCHHGGRSLKAAAFLQQRGINAKSMAGGIDLWSADIDPTVPRY